MSYALFVIFISLMFLFCDQSNNSNINGPAINIEDATGIQKRTFFPIKDGNYWVYNYSMKTSTGSNSRFLKLEIVSVEKINDSLKIINSICFSEKYPEPEWAPPTRVDTLTVSTNGDISNHGYTILTLNNKTMPQDHVLGLIININHFDTYTNEFNFEHSGNTFTVSFADSNTIMTGASGSTQRNIEQIKDRYQENIGLMSSYYYSETLVTYIFQGSLHEELGYKILSLQLKAYDIDGNYYNATP